MRVFGISIGTECYYKTAADAMVATLYDLIREIEYPILCSTKEEAWDKYKSFLKTWDQDPALTEQEKKNLLGDALLKAKAERKQHMLEAKKWDILPKKELPSNVAGEGAFRYNKVVKRLERMIQMQQGNENVK